MNKGVIIGIIIAIAIIGVIASSLSSSENPPDVNDLTEEIIEEPEPTGRSLTLELNESMGITAKP